MELAHSTISSAIKRFNNPQFLESRQANKLDYKENKLIIIEVQKIE